MDSAYQIEFLIYEVLGNRFVSGQHKFFDHLVTLCIVTRGCAADSAIFIEQNFDFRDRQIEGTTCHPPFSQHHCQSVHVAHDTENIRLELCLPRLVIREVFINFLVIKSMTTLDRTAMHFRRYRNPLCRKFY